MRNLKEGAEKTRQAIEREKIKIANVENAKTPEFLQKMVDSGELNQWRKFPNRFFVKGVDKGRIVWNEKTGIVTHDYLSDVPKEHFPAFRDAFNKAAAGARAMKSQIAATGQGDAGGGAIAQGGGTPPPSQANTDDSGRPFAPATTYTVTRKDTGEHVGEHAWDSTILPKYNRDKVNIERTQDYLGRKNAEVNNPQAGPRMGGDFASRGSVGERGNSMQANFSAGFDEAEHPRGGKDNPGQFAPKGSSSESAKPSKPIPREHAEDIASDVNISINNARHQAIKVASAYRSKFGAAKKRIIGEIKSDIARVKALAAAQVEPAMEAIRSGQDEEMSSDEIRAELEEVAPDLIAAIDRNYPDQDWQSFNPKNLKGEDGYAAAIYEDENWPDGIEDASDSDAHAEAIESVPESLQQHFDPSYDDAEIEQNVARELLKPQIDELFDTYDEHLTGNEKLRNAAYEAFDKDEDLDPGAFRAKYGATFAAYIESDHPRGQPDNPGQFAPKGGSSGVGAPAKAREAYAKIREAIAAKKKEQQSARKAKLSEFKASAKDQAKKFVDTFNRDRSAAVACVTAYEAEVERLLESSPESEVPTDPKALTAWTVEKEKQAEAIVWSKFPQFKGIEPTHGELGEFITKKVKAELSPEMQEAIDAMLGTLDTDTAAKMADLADSIYYAVDDFKDSLPDDGDQAIDDALNDDAIPPEIAAAYDPELTEAEQVKAFEDALAEDDDTESDDE